MNFDDMMKALKKGKTVTRESFSCVRYFTINKKDKKLFLINGVAEQPLEILDLQNDGIDDWVIVDNDKDK